MSSKAYIIIASAFLLTAFILIKTYIQKKKYGEVKDEKESWKFGVFYFNPGDPRIFLPKRYGIGVTLNFANPVSYILFIGIIAIALLVA
ncbi:MAG: DUF5808 domain-containing protein [Syntrophothermus sp.]